MEELKKLETTLRNSFGKDLMNENIYGIANDIYEAIGRTINNGNYDIDKIINSIAQVSYNEDVIGVSMKDDTLTIGKIDQNDDRFYLITQQILFNYFNNNSLMTTIAKGMSVIEANNLAGNFGENSLYENEQKITNMLGLSLDYDTIIKLLNSREPDKDFVDAFSKQGVDSYLSKALLNEIVQYQNDESIESFENTNRYFVDIYQAKQNNNYDNNKVFDALFKAQLSEDGYNYLKSQTTKSLTV